MGLQHTAIAFESRVYKIAPSFGLVRGIEEELGGVAALARRFSGDMWKISELVTLVHMLLQAAGKATDWEELGERVIEEGVEGYLRVVRGFLNSVTGNQKSE